MGSNCFKIQDDVKIKSVIPEKRETNEMSLSIIVGFCLKVHSGQQSV